MDIPSIIAFLEQAQQGIESSDEAIYDRDTLVVDIQNVIDSLEACLDEIK